MSPGSAGIGAPSGTEETGAGERRRAPSPAAARAHPQVAGQEPDAPLVEDHPARTVRGDREGGGRGEDSPGVERRIVGSVLRGSRARAASARPHRSSRSPGESRAVSDAVRRAGDDDAAVEGQAVIVEAEPVHERLEARAAQREGAFARAGLETEPPDARARLQGRLAAVGDVAGRRQLHDQECLVAIGEQREPDRVDVRHVPDGEGQAPLVDGERRGQPVEGLSGALPWTARAAPRAREARRAIRGARSTRSAPSGSSTSKANSSNRALARGEERRNATAAGREKVRTTLILPVRG